MPDILRFFVILSIFIGMSASARAGDCEPPGPDIASGETLIDYLIYEESCSSDEIEDFLAVNYRSYDWEPPTDPINIEEEIRRLEYLAMLASGFDCEQLKHLVTHGINITGTAAALAKTNDYYLPWAIRGLSATKSLYAEYEGRCR